MNSRKSVRRAYEESGLTVGQFALRHGFSLRRVLFAVHDPLNYDQEQELLRDEGLCHKCGHRDAYPVGSRYCPVCRPLVRAAINARRRRRRNRNEP